MDLTEQKKKIENIEFTLRAYLIPLIGIVVAILAIVFIYFPSINGILSNISSINDENNKLSTIETKIQFYKALASNENQVILTSNINTINAVLPDSAKAADVVNTLQTICQNDGLQVTTASGELVDKPNPTYPLTKEISVSLHLSGTVSQISKAIEDMLNMKQLIYIPGITIQGSLQGNAQQNVTLSANAFSMDSAEILKSLNLLNSLRTSYTASYIDSL